MAAYVSGGDMDDTKKRTPIEIYWDRLKQYLYLAAVAVIGVVGLLLFEPGGPLQNKFWEHMAMGVTVAGVIGFLIELTLHKRFADNVFKAAVGYLLREDLRGELEWIYGQSVVCKDFIATVTLTHLGQEGIVLFDCDLVRTFENISMRSSEVSLSGGTDEWFVKNHPTEVPEVSYKKVDDKEKTVLPPKPTDDGIGWSATVTINPGEELDFNVKSIHCHRENDTFIFTSRYPVKNPRIIIKCSPTLRPRVIFDHRSKCATTWETATNTWNLRGMLLPHQDIRVKWHRKDLIEQRKREFNL